MSSASHGKLSREAIPAAIILRKPSIPYESKYFSLAKFNYPKVTVFLLGPGG
jgi:hypothetical protein